MGCRCGGDFSQPCLRPDACPCDCDRDCDSSCLVQHTPTCETGSRPLSAMMLKGIVRSCAGVSKTRFISASNTTCVVKGRGYGLDVKVGIRTGLVVKIGRADASRRSGPSTPATSHPCGQRFEMSGLGSCF